LYFHGNWRNLDRRIRAKQPYEIPSLLS